MLKTRVITAAIGLPVLMILLAVGPIWLNAFLFLGCVIISTFETARMLFPRLCFSQDLAKNFGMNENIPMKKLFGSISIPEGYDFLIFSCVVLAICLFLPSALQNYDAARGMIIFVFLGAWLLGTFSTSVLDTGIMRSVAFCACLTYGVLPWLAVWDLYLLGQGSRYVIFLLAVVWCGDTGAYFGGRSFGKTPLSLRSPKKTWEGAFFGVAGSLMGGFLTHLFYALSLGSSRKIFFASILGGIFGQLGDLLESSMKRFCQVKDSGELLPGHGGFLDRVDGLLFAAPLIWFILFHLEN